MSVVHVSYDFDVDFGDIADQIQRQVVRKALYEITHDLKEDIIARTPRDTGQLRESLRTRVRVTPRIAYGRVYTVASGFYWRFLEQGTDDLPPNPFVAPVVRDIEQRIYEAFRRAWNRWTPRKF